MEPKEYQTEYVYKTCPVCQYPVAIVLGTLLYGCVNCRTVWYKNSRDEKYQQSRLFLWLKVYYLLFSSS